MRLNLVKTCLLRLFIVNSFCPKVARVCLVFARIWRVAAKKRSGQKNCKREMLTDQKPILFVSVTEGEKPVANAIVESVELPYSGIFKFLEDVNFHHSFLNLEEVVVYLLLSLEWLCPRFYFHFIK